MLEHPGSRFERHRHSRKSRRFMSLSFTKMHGAGNDFVLLDGRDGVPAELDEIARAIGDRHMGVGFDQLLVVRPGASHPYHMEIWNSDGSLAEMCGNGIRCFAKWLFDQGELSSGPVIVETAGGPRRLEIGGYVNGLFEAAVGMGVPDFEPANIPMRTDGPGSRATLQPDGLTLTVTGVSMGNPHAVTFQESVDDFPLEHIGPLVEHDPTFPERVNFEIVQVVGPKPSQSARLGTRRGHHPGLRNRRVRLRGCGRA